jgi:hypothetical protein
LQIRDRAASQGPQGIEGAPGPPGDVEQGDLPSRVLDLEGRVDNLESTVNDLTSTLDDTVQGLDTINNDLNDRIDCLLDPNTVAC